MSLYLLNCQRNRQNTFFSHLVTDTLPHHFHQSNGDFWIAMDYQVMSIVSLYAKFLHKSFLTHWPHKMLWLTQTVWCFKTNKSVWDCAKKERFQHFEYKFGVVIYWVFFWRKNYSILLSNQKKLIVQLFRVLIRCYITVPKLFLFTVMGNLFRPDLSQLFNYWHVYAYTHTVCQGRVFWILRLFF